MRRLGQPLARPLLRLRDPAKLQAAAPAALDGRPQLHKVRTWIKDKELVATDVASAGATRSRWRIDERDLEEFERKRQPAKSPPSTKRRRRKAGPKVKEFF